MDLDTVMIVIEYIAKGFAWIQNVINEYVLKNLPGVFEFLSGLLGDFDLGSIGDSISGLFG